MGIKDNIVQEEQSEVVTNETVVASDIVVLNLSAAFEEKAVEEVVLPKEAVDLIPELETSEAQKPNEQDSNYLSGKPNTVETELLGSLLDEPHILDVSPLNKSYLNFSQTDLFSTLSNSLYFSQLNALSMERFGLYHFDSFIKSFQEGETNFSFDVNTLSKVEQNNNVFSAPTVASASNIFGANGNDTINGTAGVDTLYGNALAAPAPYSLNHSIFNPTPGVSDNFGFSVAIDGNYAVVGAHYDDTAAVDSGLVYIYDVTTGGLLFTLNNPTVAVNDRFGATVSVDGNYAVVSAWIDDTGAIDAGSAYIYDVTTGSLLFTLNNPTPGVSDAFGISLAVDGIYAVVGAFKDDTGAADAGSAYIYNVTTGVLLFTLNNPTPAVNDYFGKSIALDGNYVAVGGYRDNTGATSSGSVYIYDVTTGALLFTLNNPTPAVNDYFGHDVSIDGNYLLVGTSNDYVDGVSAGSASLYDVTTGMLLFTLNNPTPEANDAFGDSVAISGNYAVIGAPSDNTGASNAGSTYIYDVTTGNLLFTLTSPMPEVGDYFGYSVDIDGNQLIVGAWDDAGAANSGAAYIYQIDFTDSDILYGGAGDDVLYGLYGDDILYGQGGTNSLFGGEGSDRFVFEGATAFDGIDRIEDFDLDQADIIDISDVLVGYTRGVSDINDFVQFTVDGADTIMAIDVNGAVGGVNFQAAALIVGGAALTPIALETAGLLDGVI